MQQEKDKICDTWLHKFNNKWLVIDEGDLHFLFMNEMNRGSGKRNYIIIVIVLRAEYCILMYECSLVACIYWVLEALGYKVRDEMSWVSALIEIGASEQCIPL